MLNEVVTDILKPALANLSMIETLGGLVNNVSKVERTPDGGQIRHTYPVSCGVTEADCFANGQYLALVPNDTKKSVAFFKAQSFTIQQKTPHSRANQYRAGARLLVWFNLGRLGVTNCEIPFAAVHAITNAISGEFPSEPMAGAATLVNVTSIQMHNPQAAFGEYTFGQKEALFMYPYSFAVFDLDILVQYTTSCIPAFTPDTAIDCVVI